MAVASQQDISHDQFSLREYLQFSVAANYKGKPEVALYDEIHQKEDIDISAAELPVQAVVDGSADFLTVKNGDIINFHFMKDTKVIKAVSEGGASCFIPLSSAYQCNILSSDHEAPFVMYAKRKGESITKDEQLLVKEVHYKNSKIEFVDGWSIKEQKMKYRVKMAHLHKSSNKTKVFLQDVADHFQYPQLVKMHFKDKTEDFKLFQPLTMRSVIATAYSPYDLIEILLPMRMKIREVESSLSGKESLCRLTNLLYHSFDPSLVKTVVGLLEDDHPCQTELFANVIGWSGSGCVHAPRGVSSTTPPSADDISNEPPRRRRARDDKEVVTLGNCKCTCILTHQI